MTKKTDTAYVVIGLKLLAAIACAEFLIMLVGRWLSVNRWLTPLEFVYTGTLILTVVASFLIFYWVIKLLKASRKTEEAYRVLFESSRDAFMILDRNRFTDCNKATLELFGCPSKAEFVTKHPSELSPPMQPDGRDSKTAAANYIDAAFATGMQLFEWLHKRSDGTLFDAEVLLNRLELYGNTVLQAVVRDVTERKKSQTEEIERLTAKNIYRMKSDFLANMSHELRTPLNSILGFSEILKDHLFGQLNEKQNGFVDDIYTSGKHLLSLINDILDLSKVEAGKMELDTNNFLLKDLLQGSLSMLKEKAMKHGMKLDMEITPEADIEIEADERKMKQIMYNLLSNAVKFTPEGGSVHIHARKGISDQGLGVNKKEPIPNNQSPTPDTDFIEISVSDTGIGVKPEDIPKLFKEFTQLESAYTKQYEGTGLGLALTKRLVELHGGKIGVESEFRKGSKFTFVIPVKQ